MVLQVLYGIFRSSCGFAFMVVGVGFFLEPHRQRVRMAFGAFYVAVGALFMLSALSTVVLLPLALDNFLLILGIYVACQALFEICLYLFGGESSPGVRLKVYFVGALWSVCIWALPLLDLLIPFSPLHVSVEDGRPMAFFQTILTYAVYLWPIVTTALFFVAGRWNPGDIPNKPGAIRVLLIGIAALVLIFVVTGFAIAFSAKALYRAGHTIVQVILLASYYYIRAFPTIFSRARSEISSEHKRRNSLSDEEAKAIGAKLQKLMDGKYAFGNPELDLAELAKLTGLPAYRLSMYLNTKLNLSFSEWLNKVRVDYVCVLLERRTDMNIMEVALEAGYASKTVFNKQFQRIVGIKPSEYRTRFTASKSDEKNLDRKCARPVV